MKWFILIEFNNGDRYWIEKDTKEEIDDWISNHNNKSSIKYFFIVQGIPSSKVSDKFNLLNI